MLLKLVAAGCSFTHGAELDHPFMSEGNIRQSYSAVIANSLNLELHNVALSGCSNDYIFHTAVKQIRKYNDIQLLTVCWTHPTRLTWQAFDRTYIIHPTFGTALTDVYLDPKHRQHRAGMYMSSDTDMIDELEAGIKFAVSHMLDPDELEQKRENHSLALQSLSKEKGIRLIETHVMNFREVGSYNKENRHPNAEEHVLIANQLLEEMEVADKK